MEGHALDILFDGVIQLGGFLLVGVVILLVANLFMKWEERDDSSD